MKYLKFLQEVNFIMIRLKVYRTVLQIGKWPLLAMYMDQNATIGHVYLSSIWILKINKFSFLRTKFSIMIQRAVLLHLLDEGTHILVPREKMLKGFFSILERERDWVERAASRERRMNQQVHENGQNSTHYYWVRFHAALMLLPTASILSLYVGRTHR